MLSKFEALNFGIFFVFVFSELSIVQDFFTYDISKMLFIQWPCLYARPTISCKKGEQQRPTQHLR